MTNETAFFIELGARLRTQKIRTMREFAEQEIVLPTGPYKGFKFSCDRQPVARLLFDELDSGRWARAFVVACNQNGKSLLAFVIAIMYVLFELRENLIVGVPSENMMADKWNFDLKPMIKASRFADYLPKAGGGSRGGKAVTIEMENGAAIRFMTEGGDDQSRAAFSAAHLRVTEVNGFDNVGSSSVEGSKFKQLERRLLAFGSSATMVAECTAGTEKGILWTEYTNGTKSRIAIRCQHCRNYVTPEREHLVGWKDAKSVREARDNAAICCPSCAVVWTEAERIEANRDCKLAHKGQTVLPNGTINGPMPDTDTLGFRWTCVNDLISDDRIQNAAAKEWRAKFAEDQDEAERDIRQSDWALPAESAEKTESEINAESLVKRIRLGSKPGFCPPETICVTTGVDVGKYRCHWVAIAWLQGATPHVIAHGVKEVASNQLGVEHAIPVALRELQEVFAVGFPVDGDESRRIASEFNFVDSGYETEAVMTFIRETQGAWFPVKGFGVSQTRSMNQKRETGSKVVESGEHYAIIETPSGDTLVEINVDEWKTWLHNRANTPIDSPGAFTMADDPDKWTLARHLSSEKMELKFEAGKGVVRYWSHKPGENHRLDATVYACVAGHCAGMRLFTHDAPGDAEESRDAEPEQSYVNSYKGQH